jgi:hypothetical protein
MFMFLGATLFALLFIMIAPASRAFVIGCFSGAATWITGWAPFSFVIIAIVVGAGLYSIHLVRTWPVHVEPENPMAKYRRDPLLEPDEF